MCKVIAVANQKGGVGKTTTTVSLGFGLASLGKRVLLIDTDPQGSLTISMGYTQPDSLEVTLATLLGKVINDEIPEEGEGIMHHEEGLDYIPGNIELSGLEVSLVNVFNRERILKEYVDVLRANYDYILIDCMPSLGMLTINVLSCADSVLIPVQAAFLPAKGLEQLIRTIGKVSRNLNPKLKIEGILLTMVDMRTNFARSISELITETYGNNVKIFSGMIPLSVRAVETTAKGISIYKHSPNGKVALAYRELTEEVIENGRE